MRSTAPSSCALASVYRERALAGAIHVTPVVPAAVKVSWGQITITQLEETLLLLFLARTTAGMKFLFSGNGVSAEVDD